MDTDPRTTSSSPSSDNVDNDNDDDSSSIRQLWKRDASRPWSQTEEPQNPTATEEDNRDDDTGDLAFVGMAPRDEWHLVFGVFSLLGVAMLFPWNVFITATAFFELRFQGSPFADTFSSFFTIGYNLTNFLGLVVLLRYVRHFSMFVRVPVSLLANLAIFVAITALVYVTMDPSVFFYIVMVCVVTSGAMVALLQNGIFTMASKFPPQYTTYVMSGQGLAGLAVALSQIFTTMLSDPDVEPTTESTQLSALLYFLVADVVLAVAVGGYALAHRLPMYRFYRDKKGPEEEKRLLNGHETGEAAVGAAERRVFRKISSLVFSVFFCFFVTLSVFPTVTSAVESTQENPSSRLFKDLFVPFSFVLFNAFDYLGRTAAGWFQLIPARWLWAVSLARVVFIPLFLLCNVVLRDSNGDPVDLFLPVVFSSDYVFWLFMVAFSLSNGYVASLSMMYGPNQPEVRFSEREPASAVMLLFLVFGLFVGSLFSFALRALLCACNPFVS